MSGRAFESALRLLPERGSQPLFSAVDCGLEVQQSQVRGTDHSHGVSLFPVTFLTNGHQLSGLRQQKGIPAQSGGQESGVRNQESRCR